MSLIIYLIYKNAKPIKSILVNPFREIKLKISFYVALGKKRKKMETKQKNSRMEITEESFKARNQ